MEHHRSRAWFLSLVAAVAALILYAWTALQVYSLEIDPVVRDAGTIGPAASTQVKAAEKRIQLGLELLNDGSLSPGKRLAAYRDELSVAERLLLNSLRVQPVQAMALAALVAVRWELSPAPSGEENARRLAMIALASDLAPTAPGLQQRLGEALLKLGQRGEAMIYFARAIELNPECSVEVIGKLSEHLFTAQEIFDGLPEKAAVLAALEQPFANDGAELEYLDIVERAIDANPQMLTSQILAAYGDTCLRLGKTDRMREWMSMLSPLAQPDAEATRLLQLSRASLDSGQVERALREALAARERHPDSIPQLRHLGKVALAAGRSDIALEAFREALSIVVKRTRNPSVRAELYSRIGQAEELRGDLGRAYDSYRMALKLNPDEPYSRRRIREMEAEAGFGEPPP